MIQAIYRATENSILTSRDGRPVTLQRFSGRAPTGMDVTLVFATFADGLTMSVLPEEIGWRGCERCGWQYPTAILNKAAEGVIDLDFNPTHVCDDSGDWVTMSPESEQAWHNGYFRPWIVRETEHGVEYRPPQV